MSSHSSVGIDRAQSTGNVGGPRKSMMSMGLLHSRTAQRPTTSSLERTGDRGSPAQILQRTTAIWLDTTRPYPEHTNIAERSNFRSTLVRSITITSSTEVRRLYFNRLQVWSKMM